MPPLPIVKPGEAIKVFTRFGWEVNRQKGSYIILTKIGSYSSLSVPNHDEFARGTLRSLIMKSGITFEEFIRELKK
jgi:predicted RNA binding protein YcfA (HicA-like mRNA interferase family)